MLAPFRRVVVASPSRAYSLEHRPTTGTPLPLDSRYKQFAIPSSASLMATVDPSQTLPEGAVCLLKKGQPLVLPRLLLYKSPGLHPGDVRAARAVAPTEQLAEHLKSGEMDLKCGQTVLIFSSRGPRPLADMIAGSDYDGDVFSAIWNEQVLECWPEQDEEPWQPAAAAAAAAASASDTPDRPSQLESAELRRRLRCHLMYCRRGQSVLSDLATKWKGWTHKENAGSVQARRLALLYMDALDAGKGDRLPRMDSSLRQVSLPYHLRKTASIRADEARKQTSATDVRPNVMLRMWNAVVTNDIFGQQHRTTCWPVQLDEDLKVYRYASLPLNLLQWDPTTTALAIS